jgi:transglutaminase-like putative cysteine protease
MRKYQVRTSHAVAIIALSAIICATIAYLALPELPSTYPENPQRFIQPWDSQVQSIAAELSDAEDCYYWVAQNIRYVPDYSLGSDEVWLYPSQTISLGRGDCEDFAILLCSLIRAVGIPASEVRVVAGTIPSDGDNVGHAWVELWYGGQWLPLEPSTRGHQTPPFDYYLTHEHVEVQRYYWFNDEEYEKLAC